MNRSAPVIIHNPRLWRLELAQNSRVFQQKNTQAILQTLLTEGGVVDTVFNLRQPVAEREYCVQYRETCLDYFQRLAAEEGWHYFFEHQGEQTGLTIADHHMDARKLAEADCNIEVDPEIWTGA